MPFFLHPRADDATVAALQDRAGRRRGRSRPPCCRCTGGPARTRTSGRPPSATGSGHPDHRRARCPRDELGVQRPPRAGRRERGRSSGGRWRSCCRSSSARASRCAWSRTRTTSSRTAAPRSTWSAGSTSPGWLPVLRPAHVPPGRRRRRDHALRGGPADPRARRRLLRPPGSSGLRYIVNPPGSPPGSTSTSTSARARSTGTSFFGTLGATRLRRRPSPPASSPGRSGPGSPPAANRERIEQLTKSWT